MLERNCVFLLTARGIHCPIVAFYWGDVWAEMILSSPVCTMYVYVMLSLSACMTNVAGRIPKPVV